MMHTAPLPESERLPQAAPPAFNGHSEASGTSADTVLSEAVAPGSQCSIPDAAPDVWSVTGMDEGRPFGLFFALRSVALIYLGCGITAALGYELWCLLTR